MEPGNGDATAIVKPHHHSTPLRINRGVLTARHVVATPPARQDGKGLKRPYRQELANICDHFVNLSTSAYTRKHPMAVPDPTSAERKG
jgi:hypothetical protein